jgi:hypothetical protein
MSEKSGLDVEKARHPLQERCVGTFIPNDIKLGVDDGPDAGIRGIIVPSHSFYYIAHWAKLLRKIDLSKGKG